MTETNVNSDLATLFWVVDMFPEELGGLLAVADAMRDQGSALPHGHVVYAAGMIHQHVATICTGLGLMQDRLAALRIALPEGSK